MEQTMISFAKSRVDYKRYGWMILASSSILGMVSAVITTMPPISWFWDPLYTSGFSIMGGWGVSWVGFNLFALVIALIPFRRGERWSWYLLWLLPLLWVSLFALAPDTPLNLVLAALTAIGLILPYRTYFPHTGEQAETVAGTSETPGEESRRNSARRLSLLGTALVALILVVIPLAIGPDNLIVVGPAGAFVIAKFRALLILSGLLLVAILGHLLLRGRPYSVPVLLPALAFLGVATFSALLSGDFVNAAIGRYLRFDGLLSLGCGILLFFAAARFLDSWKKVRVVLIAGVAAAIIVSIYGILQMFGPTPVVRVGLVWPYPPESVTEPLKPLYSLMDRAFSTVGYPLELANYLTLMVAAALALYFKATVRWERGIWLAAMALMAGCWLYTYTRGAMLGCAVAVPILAFLAYRRLGTLKPLVLPMAVIAAGILGAVLLNPLSTDVSSRIGQTNVAAEPGEVPEGGDVSVATRLMIWRDAVPMIADRPLFGYGPDNFTRPFENYESAELRALTSDRTVDKAHNELVQVAATTGLLGLAAYLWIFVSYFRKSYQSGGWPLLALSGGVLAYILQLMTWNTTLTTGVTFWAILGASVAIMQIQNREEPTNQPSTQVS